MGRYIGVLMALAFFLMANGLQYTHDTTHHHTHHHCSIIDGDKDVAHTEADECSLCWFISHQMGVSFVFNTLLPEATIQENRNAHNERYRLFCQDGVQRSLGNKDPPSAV